MAASSAPQPSHPPPPATCPRPRCASLPGGGAGCVAGLGAGRPCSAVPACGPGPQLQALPAGLLHCRCVRMFCACVESSPLMAHARWLATAAAAVLVALPFRELLDGICSSPVACARVTCTCVRCTSTGCKARAWGVRT